jgi:hypothetical protein
MSAADETILDPSAYRDRIRALLDRYPDADDAELAERLVARMNAPLRRQLLVSFVAEDIDTVRRIRAHQIEQEARRRAATQARPPEPEPEVPPEPNHRPEDFQRLYDNPGLWRNIFFADTPPQCIGKWNTTSREQYRQWCDATYGDGAFEGWLDRGILLTADEPDDMEDFENAWVPRYLSEWAINRLYTGDVYKVMQEWADNIRFEVTAELLDTIFAVGDGTKVTWRDATVAQHEERAEMLTKMAAGTIETAAMHTAAVRIIKDAGVDSLGQVAS